MTLFLGSMPQSPLPWRYVWSTSSAPMTLCQPVWCQQPCRAWMHWHQEAVYRLAFSLGNTAFYTLHGLYDAEPMEVL